MASRTMAFADFSGRVGKTFEVNTQGYRVPLVLDAAQELPGVRDGGAFRLEFTGPRDPLFVQGIFPFQIGGDSFEIFIVPIGPNERGMRYEAIFY